VHINVNNIQSLTGRVYGIASWYSSVWNFDTHSKIKVNDIFAGIGVKRKRFEYLSMPNHGPEACAVGIYNGKTAKHPGAINIIDDMDNYYDTFVEQYCIEGHFGCWGDPDLYTDLDEISDRKLCEQPANRKLKSKLLNDAEFDPKVDGKDDYDPIKMKNSWQNLPEEIVVLSKEKLDKNKDMHGIKKFDGDDEEETNEGKKKNKGKKNKEQQEENQEEETYAYLKRRSKGNREAYDAGNYLNYYANTNYYMLVAMGLTVLLCGFCLVKYYKTNKGKTDQYTAVNIHDDEINPFQSYSTF